MTLEGGLLKAEPQKGMLRAMQDESTMVHVVWQLRAGAEATGEPLEDQIVFPEECSLREIPSQPRCYELHFPADASRSLFFWLQEPKAEHDRAHIARFNAAVNGKPLPPLPAAPAPAAPAAPSTSAPSAAAAGSNPQASALAAMLSQALAAAGAGPAPPQPDARSLAHSLLAQMAAARGPAPDEGPGLHEVLRPEVVVPLLSEPGVLERLAPHLPEEHRSQRELVATAHSPQFAQQLAAFSAALQSGQLDLAQFGLNAKGYSVAAFLEAVGDLVERERAQGGSGSGAGGAAPMEH
uniref:Pru domain-containing protein n=1 Tax=Chlamydomonas leiostraca TaxID=1034604 RepID=A0A7S0RUT9_9CHLO